MTKKDEAAEAYANYQCGLFNKNGLHPKQKPYYDYHYSGFKSDWTQGQEELVRQGREKAIPMQISALRGPQELFIKLSDLKAIKDQK